MNIRIYIQKEGNDNLQERKKKMTKEMKYTEEIRKNKRKIVLRESKYGGFCHGKY